MPIIQVVGVEFIRTDKDTNFTGALVQNAGEAENLDFPTDWKTTQINEVIIHAIRIQSDQNLEWDIYLWKRDTGANTDLDVDTFSGLINFPATSGKQIAGSNQFYYSLSNLNLHYQDEDKSGKIHCMLINRSSTAKLAGGTGEVVVEFVVSPVLIT